MGRNELSANAIGASTHRCSENVFTYRTKRLRVTGVRLLLEPRLQMDAVGKPVRGRCGYKRKRNSDRCGARSRIGARYS